MSTPLDNKPAAKMNSQEEPKSSQSEQQLMVEKIFTKGLLFESAALTRAVIQSSLEANLELQFSISTSEQDKEMTEVILTLNITAKANNNLIWRIQLQEAGFYKAKGFSVEQQKAIFHGYCANQLYVYAGSVVTNTISQGGFAPVFLPTINFEVLYQEQLKEEAMKTQPKSAPAPVAMTH